MAVDLVIIGPESNSDVLSSALNIPAIPAAIPAAASNAGSSSMPSMPQILEEPVLDSAGYRGTTNDKENDTWSIGTIPSGESETLTTLPRSGH